MRRRTSASSELLGIHPGQVIRSRRQWLGWKAVELARRAEVDPRTINAIEKERIKTPSLKNLVSLAHALDISVASLFSAPDPQENKIFLNGNQKGNHTLAFSKAGFRVICYSPMIPDLFVGKVILSLGTHVGHERLPTQGMIFAQPIIGKLRITFDGEEFLVREGSYVFFDGRFPHSYSNPELRESTFLLVTAPSFLSSGNVVTAHHYSSTFKKGRS